MTPAEIAKALRCTATEQTGDEPCESCPFNRTEALTEEQKAVLCCEEWHSCDVDGIALAAAARSVRLEKELQETREQVQEMEDALETDECTLAEMLNVLEAYKEGRVVVLPCKVGDTVYFVNAKQILKFAVVGYAVDETGISWVYSEHVDKAGHTNERAFSKDRINMNTFLTREEAEKALEERKDETS